ncbi:MAG: hypothetical protein ACM33U_09035 [Solirubrobacterales bacterium]|nr:hypothetical protein [Solirubrobacterales bacterium]
MTYRGIVAALVLALAATNASAAARPVASETNTGRGAAVIAIVPLAQTKTWRVVVTTKPTRLPVLIQTSGRKSRGWTPVSFFVRCARPCPLSVTAQLWVLPGTRILASGRITASIYRS